MRKVNYDYHLSIESKRGSRKEPERVVYAGLAFFYYSFLSRLRFFLGARESGSCERGVGDGQCLRCVICVEGKFVYLIP